MKNTQKHHHHRTNQRNPNNNAHATRIRELLRDWKLEGHPRIAKCFEIALSVMIYETLYALLDPRLQVAVVPGSNHGVWAYFPVSNRREIVRRHDVVLTAYAKILLVVSEEHVVDRPIQATLNEIAHQIGHIFAYLRAPGHVHDCAEANAIALEVGFAKVAVQSDEEE